MKIIIEKYDLVKGVTYKRDFELDTEAIILEKGLLTLAIIQGNFDTLNILCKDTEKVQFTSVRVCDNIIKDCTFYHFDTIKYYNNGNIKVLLAEGDTL